MVTMAFLIYYQNILILQKHNMEEQIILLFNIALAASSIVRSAQERILFNSKKLMNELVIYNLINVLTVIYVEQ